MGVIGLLTYYLIGFSLALPVFLEQMSSKVGRRVKIVVGNGTGVERVRTNKSSTATPTSILKNAKPKGDNSSDDSDSSSDSEGDLQGKSLKAAQEYRRRNAEAVADMKRAAVANQSTFDEALAEEKEREAKRKAMKRAKRLRAQKRLDDAQKEKERLQKLADEIFSLAGYGFLNELIVLQETPGFDEALKLPSRFGGDMPILWAAANNELRTMEWLFAEKGCDLHVCDDHGRNICLKGAWRGHQRIIEYGYEFSVDFMKQNIAGENMVHEAAYNGHTHIVKYCQSLGVPLDQENELGETPVMFCALNGHIEALAYFINVGTEEGGGVDGVVNFYQLGYRGRNVIHYAALGGIIASLEYLWDNARDKFKWEDRDFDEKTPLDLAMDHSNETAADFLCQVLDITDFKTKLRIRKLQADAVRIE